MGASGLRGCEERCEELYRGEEHDGDLGIDRVRRCKDLYFMDLGSLRAWKTPASHQAWL